MHPRRSLPVLLAVTPALAIAAGCQTGSQRSTAQTPTVNTGLDQVASDGPAFPRGSVAGMPEQSTEELLALMEEAQQNASVSVAEPDQAPATPAITAAPQATQADPTLDTTSPDAQSNTGPSMAIDDAPSTPTPVAEPIELAEDTESDPPAPAEPEPTPRERAEAGAHELGSFLRAEAAFSPMPVSELVRLGALEIAHPGVLGEDEPGVSMPPRDEEIATEWRTFATAVRDRLDSADDPAAIADDARALADGLDAWRPIIISSAHLCTRVDGFGNFRELPTFNDEHRFLAARPISFIVYAELDRFSHTSASRDSEWGYEVALSMDLRLYHVGSDADALVWRKPDQLITDFSRRQRRDFFVLQRVDLPATLGVGSYRLKLTIKDRASAGVAERLIPFEIVANTAALRE